MATACKTLFSGGLRLATRYSGVEQASAQNNKGQGEEKDPERARP